MTYPWRRRRRKKKKKKKKNKMMMMMMMKKKKKKKSKNYTATHKGSHKNSSMYKQNCDVHTCK
jgi:hypothetical protein